MAIIPRTTTALDAEIILPDATLSTEAALYKEWQDTFVSPNPIQSQVEFFQNLTTRIQNREVGVEVYNYWYNKVKASHPAVIDNLTGIAQYADVNESVGTLYFADSTAPSTDNGALGSSSIKPYPENIESLLPNGLSSLAIDTYNKVNQVYSDNIANVTIGKDTASNLRNTLSKPLIKAQLESKFGVALDLTEIENTITGDVTVAKGEFSTNIEGTTVQVDDLGSRIDEQSTLTIGSLKAT